MDNISFKKLLIKIFNFYEVDLEAIDAKEKLEIYFEDLKEYSDYMNLAWQKQRKIFIPRYKGHLPSVCAFLTSINEIKREKALNEVPKQLPFKPYRPTEKEFENLKKILNKGYGTSFNIQPDTTEMQRNAF